MKKLSIAFSTCPNDTFMFDAWVNRRIPEKLPDTELHLADIEKLNKLAQEGIPDVCKVSIAVLPDIAEHYELLPAGAAIGYRNGPLVVSRKKIYPEELPYAVVAIPGKKTTANLLLSILFPEVKQKKEYLFSDIEEVVMEAEADAGLLIHETRFTYEKKGLLKVTDLGELWEKETRLPIPLGGIVVKRSLPAPLKKNIAGWIKQSVQQALENPAPALPFIKKYAQSMEEEVIEKHIHLYVNDFSADMGTKGKDAIQTLLSRGAECGLLPEITQSIFLI